MYSCMNLKQLMCKVPIFLTYIMFAYFIASIYYMIATKDIGTPYKEALKEAIDIAEGQSSGTKKKLEDAKKESKEQRSKIFWTGMLIGGVILFVFKPFSHC